MTASISFQEHFKRHEGFFREGELYYQKDISRNAGFEENYVSLREHEGRLLPDAMVRNLPAVPESYPLRREWMIRERSVDRLVLCLRKKKRVRRILEVGCGNGWLTNHLCERLAADCCGVDINETELHQAVRVFSDNRKITFVYGDILSPAFDGCHADVIVLASVIQYFPDLSALLDKLTGRLDPGGEIHIIDSPLYHEHEVALAKERSQTYFERTGHPAMRERYHHHTWRSFQGHNYEIIYDPSSAVEKVRRLLTKASPFPWVRLTQ